MVSEVTEELQPALEAPERSLPKRVILDVGSGAYPFPVGLRQRKIQKGEIYIGIDPDTRHAKENFRLVSDKRAGATAGEGKGFMAIGVGERLPLRNNSVDEVVIANVIGDPKITGRPQVDLLSASPVKGIIHEIARVLKDNGQAHVVESNTPYPNHEDIIALFKTAGLVHTRTSKRIGQFSILPPSDDSYLLEFIKS
ncbi:MAG: hypothetical protein HY377_02020 [Candidatus Blackburnbacteria bacterium]|nr:hypothetical protein [Candidatus Blackburnbacteria bacterium]